MCWSANRERFPVPSRCINGEWKVALSAEFDRLWEQLQARHGASGGTRLMIELLREGQRVGYERLRQAIERALELGCVEAEAVTYLGNNILDTPRFIC